MVEYFKFSVVRYGIMSREEVGLDWLIDFNLDLLFFFCGGEMYNYVIGVRYEFLNEYLLIIMFVEGV